MRKFYLLLLVLICAGGMLPGQNKLNYLNNQEILSEYDSELIDYDLKKLKTLSELTLPARYRNKLGNTLPDHLDNSTLKYFRPVFMQYGWSCNQSASIGYMFTYELNAKRDQPASISSNQYPFRFVWNFLNNADWGQGVSYFDSWEIIKAIGSPNKNDYWSGIGAEEDTWEHTQWMSGYDYYYNGMRNTIYDLYNIKVDSPEGLQTLKQWMLDHLDGSPNGGVANFQIASTGMNIQAVPDESEEPGEPIIISFGSIVGHAMTFVGYNDNVQYDYNGDGEFTNDKDINHDGVVNMLDWEIGAMICVNSWGNGWPGGDFNGGGKVFVMYRLLAETTNKGGIYNNTVNVVRARTNYRPLLTMKVYMSHNYRGKIKISAGVSSVPDAEQPEHIIDFPVFNYNGSAWPMCGTNRSDSIEFGIDITPLLSYVIPGEVQTFYLIVDENDEMNTGEGHIMNFSLIDYTGAVREIEAGRENVPIINNDRTLITANGIINFDKVKIISDELPPAEVSGFYEYQLEAEQGEAPYKWYKKSNYDITTGIESFPKIIDEYLYLGGGENYGFVRKDLEFDFPFYGEYYDHVYVTADGGLVFDDNMFVWPYVIDEELLLKKTKTISPYGTDLKIYDEEQDGIYYSGNNTVASFYWDATIDKWDMKSDVNVVVRLYQDGKIEFLYGLVNSMGVYTRWVGGISKGDGINYQLTPTSNTTFVSPSSKTIFTPSKIPAGISLSENGILSGIPTENNKSWELEFVVIDQDKVFDSKKLNFYTGSTGINDIIDNSLVINSYPNPFSDDININLRVEKAGNTRINIFNIRGQLIKTLTDEYLGAGNYNFIWNGNRIPGGIYYLRVLSGDVEKTVKIVKR